MSILHFGTFLASSLWGSLINGEASPLTIVLLCVVAAAVIAIVVLLFLLLLPFRLTLHLGEGKERKERHFGHKGVELHAPASRDGYDFAGWFEDEGFTRPVKEVYRMPMRNAHLYAKWIETAEAEEAVYEDAKNAVMDVLAELPTIKEVPAAETGETLVSAEEELPEEDLSEQEEDVADEDVAEGDEIEGALVTPVSGGKVFVQYRRSFTARLIQADDKTKEFYNRLRSELLSCVGVKERVSWNYLSFNVGRRQFAKINANAKSLIVYLALDPAEVDEKYNFRDVSGKKRYGAVPVRYKITGSRSLGYALELVEQTAAKFGLDFLRKEEIQDIPYEERDALIAKKLIKVYAKRDTGETVTVEQLGEMIAEGAKVEKLSSYTVTDSVSANEAEGLITDATAKQLMALADIREGSALSPGKRTYVNLDTISANYEEGDIVDLASLKAKGLVDKKAASCKILARGTLDKSLTVEAADFSLAAIKMIAITGGKVVRIRKN